MAIIGYDTKGSSLGDIDGTAIGRIIEPTEDGTATGGAFYVDYQGGNPTVFIGFALYDSSLNLLTQGGASAFSPDGFIDITFDSSVGIESGETYWLVGRAYAISTTFYDSMASGSNVAFYASTFTPGSAPSTISPIAYWEDRNFSAYLTYTPGGGGPSAPTNSPAIIGACF